MEHIIYVRVLKHADHTVFGVTDGQKTFWDPLFEQSVPYASGQQIKRSFMDMLTSVLNEVPSPTTFVSNVESGKANKRTIGEGEVYATCNPSYADQMIGGWMKAQAGGTERTLKRRSPFSISAMRALHPLLSSVNKENATFDRSERHNNVIIVKDEKGNILSPEEINAILAGQDRSLSRKWLKPQTRATGLFVQDMAIDMRRLFAVLLNPFEPEITPETEAALRKDGWIETQSVFGKCLTAPRERREQLIPAIAEAILNWRITSNQSRTFSLMETLAVGISGNANKIAACIRAKLSEEEENKVEPVVESIPGAEVFVTPAAGGYLRTKSETADAMDLAYNKLVELLSGYDYEQPIQAK